MQQPKTPAEHAAMVASAQASLASAQTALAAAKAAAANASAAAVAPAVQMIPPVPAKASFMATLAAKLSRMMSVLRIAKRG